MSFPMSPYGSFRMRYTPALPQFYENIYSQEEGIKKILYELDSLATFANQVAKDLEDETQTRGSLALRVNQIVQTLNEIQDGVSQYLQGGKTRDPIDGSFSPVYGVLKQIVDFYNSDTLTWNECKQTGVTWDQLAQLGAENSGGSYMSYAAFDLESVMWLTSAVGSITHETVCYNSVDDIDTDTNGYSMEVK